MTSHDKNAPLFISLFNYGGGMRGLIPAHIMAYIENRTGLRMAEMVDVFTGPSTGAILNAGLNVPNPKDPTKPKFRARHMVKFYEREGAKIFPPDNFRDFRGLIHDFNNRTMKIGQLNRLFRHGHYDPSYLAGCMKRLYGETKLSDTVKSIIIPVYNIDGEQLKLAVEPGESQDAPVHTLNNFVDEGGHAVWFKNLKFAKEKLHCPKVKLYDTVIATTAAPTYFPCHHFKATRDGFKSDIHYTGIDGSLFDNPCINYHGALRRHIPEGAKHISIVLGTGYTQRSISKDDWNSYGGLGVVDPVHDLPLIRILFHAPESALTQSYMDDLGDGLFMFNKSMIAARHTDTPSDDIDDASPENLEKLRRFARVIIEDNITRLDELCDLLVQNYENTGKKPSKNGFLDIFK
jgi:hypothetical protein